jgi:peptidoglycan-associated lipoprotein
MRIQLVSLFAAALLLAACESTPETGTAATGTGATGATGGQATSSTRSPREIFTTEVGDRVFFAYNMSDLSADARRTLERQANWLKQYNTQRLTIEGHCDERGTREYNLALGERRANAVRDYLVALGIPAARLSTISYGKERPVVLGANEAAFAQNRRGVSVPQ